MAADIMELCSTAGIFIDEATDAADCTADSINWEAWAGLEALTPVIATAIAATGANGLEPAAEQVVQTEPP